MTDLSTVTLTAAQRGSLLSLQQNAQSTALAQLRLASGRKVNSALDNPANFFAARSVRNAATDASRLLDGLGQNLQVIKAASHGLDTLQDLLKQAEALAVEALNGNDTGTATAVALQDQILANNPAAYLQLNDTSGSAVANQGSGAITASYAGGVTKNQPPLYSGGGASASFSGSGQYINISNSPLINTTVHGTRTIEMAFNADTVSGRQVLYEEGGTTNSLTIYIDNGNLYVTGRDAGDWGPFNISAPVTAGQTYHVALQLDQPNGEFRGYLDGNLIGTGAMPTPLSSHTAAIAIGGMRGGAWFHDGAQNGNNYYFNGRISDFALYNTVIPSSSIASHAAVVTGSVQTDLASDFNTLLRQIDQVAKESGYRGTNLLSDSIMKSTFNAKGTASYDTKGQDMSAAGLGIDDATFESVADVQTSLNQVRAGLDSVRAFGTSLTTSLNIIQTRSDMTTRMININEEGADKLTLADMNEESAQLLALQTRQFMQVSILSQNTNSSNALLSLFSGTA